MSKWHITIPSDPDRIAEVGEFLEEIFAETGWDEDIQANIGIAVTEIVNNAILLIHFALEKMAEGMSKREAMLESIKIRTRPVLMTAFAVAAGMLPVALGSAIGLERLAPLGAVAIGGLLVGTFLTLLFIPLIFIWTTKELKTE